MISDIFVIVSKLVCEVFEEVQSTSRQTEKELPSTKRFRRSRGKLVEVVGGDTEVLFKKALQDSRRTAHLKEDTTSQYVVRKKKRPNAFMLWSQGKRKELIKKIETLKEDSFSDHRPKIMTVKTEAPKYRNKKRQMARIRTETLRIPEVRQKFVEKTKEAENEIESNGWEKAAAKIHNIAKEVCGKKEKSNSLPWLEGREAECEEYRRKINEAVQKTRENPEERESENS